MARPERRHPRRASAGRTAPRPRAAPFTGRRVRRTERRDELCGTRAGYAAAVRINGVNARLYGPMGSSARRVKAWASCADNSDYRLSVACNGGRGGMECSRSGAVEAIGRVRLVRRRSRGAPPGLPLVSSSVRNRPTVAGRPSSRFAPDAGVRLWPATVRQDSGTRSGGGGAGLPTWRLACCNRTCTPSIRGGEK